MTETADGRTLKPLFTWRSAIVESELKPTVRHVALTLSLHMNERGGSCFPSMETLERETGLNVATVRRALKTLDETGWLTREVSHGRGRSNRYTATVPENRAEDAVFGNRAEDAFANGKPRAGDLENRALCIGEDVNLEDDNKPKNEDVKQTLVGTASAVPTVSLPESHTLICLRWTANSPPLIAHRPAFLTEPKTVKATDKAAGRYGSTDVCAAIENYAAVLASPDHWFSYRWTLPDFLTRGLDLFVPEAVPLDNYRHKPLERTTRSGDRAVSVAEMQARVSAALREEMTGDQDAIDGDRDHARRSLPAARAERGEL